MRALNLVQPFLHLLIQKKIWIIKRIQKKIFFLQFLEITANQIIKIKYWNPPIQFKQPIY